MSKEHFKYLYSFKYNNKDYIYLISKNYPLYFLEYNTKTNEIEYPDIDTFKEIYTLFDLGNQKLQFNIIEELKKIKSKLFNKSFNVTPMVKTTSGLVSIAIALSLCGCQQTPPLTSSPVTEPPAVVETTPKDKEIYDYFKSYGMEVTNREYSNNDYIFVNEFTNSNNQNQITINNFDEFRNINQINFIPTWDDVISAFKNNNNIDSDKLEIIINGINNMKTCDELKNMDLSVLYINAKKMKFKYCTTDEMIQEVNRESVYAYFEPTSGTVYLPKDKPLEKFEFIHEVLGHGSLAYREEKDDSLYVFDCTNYLMLLTDNRYTGQSIGTVVSEGGANMIAHLATNDYSVSTFYELYEEELRVIAELCNVSIGELFNHKGVSLYDLMYKNGINTPVEYIYYMDGIFKGQLYFEFSSIMERLFVDATEEKIMSSNEAKQDEIIKATLAIIRDSYFKEKGELSFDYVGGNINYNFEEAANQYEENINDLKNNK